MVSDADSQQQRRQMQQEESPRRAHRFSSPQHQLQQQQHAMKPLTSAPGHLALAAEQRSSPLLPRATQAARQPRHLVEAGKGAGTVEHVVVKKEILEQRIARQNEAESDLNRRAAEPDASEERILGPFMARSEEDVLAVKRALILEQRSAAGWIQRRRDIEPRQDELLPGPVKIDEQDEPQQSAEEMLFRRQTDAENTCYVGNEFLSCYPTSGIQVVQGTWSKFIWNHNYPRFRQIGAVDVYLFRQDTDQMQTSWISLDNNLGRLSFSPNDPWWGDRPRAAGLQPGMNMTWPFYFVVTAHGLGLDSNTISRQSTFSAIQTALPSSIASAQSSSSSVSASLASASASSSSASAALSDAAAISSASQSIVTSISNSLVSSMNAAGSTGTEMASRTITTTLPNGSIVTASATAEADGRNVTPAGYNNGLGLPKYAIALISVFGFLALVGALVGAYFLLKSARKRRERISRNENHSYGSGSPMMRAIDAPGSVAGGSDGNAALAAAAGGVFGGGAATRSSNESHPFSSDEATRMADAFRNALRKPEFAGTALSSDQNSPNEHEIETDAHFDEAAPAESTGPTPRELIRNELASEGKDLRSVGRGRPKVHGE